MAGYSRSCDDPDCTFHRAGIVTPDGAKVSPAFGDHAGLIAWLDRQCAAGPTGDEAVLCGYEPISARQIREFLGVSA